MLTAQLVNTSDLMESILSTVMQGAESGLQVAAGNQSARMRQAFAEDGYRDGENLPVDGRANVRWEPTTDVALLERTNPPESEISLSPAGRMEVLFTGEWNTLVDTGTLRDSIIEGQVERSGEESVVEVGTDVPYAAGMDQGTTITVDGNTYDVPARPFMFMTELDADRILADVARGLPDG